MLTNQSDIVLLEVKDYIKNPKPNGYRSLHLVVEVPVFISDRKENVCVEVQIRTIAMDFWASLEHKLFYKYKKSIPNHLLQELKDAAESATALDLKMERLHTEIDAIKEEQEDEDGDELVKLLLSQQELAIPPMLMGLLSDGPQK
ncbi:GTP pyrophosphokinase YwaC [compost metagenome]